MDSNLIKRVFETMEYGPAPEADAPAYEWLERHEHRFGLYIDGRFRDPHSHEWFPATAPGRKHAELGHIARADDTDINDAVRAASQAQTQWQKLGAHARARYLYAIARHIQKHARLFSVLESLDNGKPIRESRDIDIPLVARHFYHHAGWAQLMEKELSDYVPIGVVGQIIPWNFPLLMLAWKIAPALAMGNTLVLKPAEFTSLTALLFAEVCHEVGLPPGVINLVTGDGRTGAALVRHPDIGKIAFTGSTEVGRNIREATAGTGKKLSLELGGKSPFIIFDDADLDSAVEGVVDAIWFNQGEVCCAGSRILVQENIAPRLLTRLRARMETLRVGDSLDKCIDIGAIISKEQLARIESLVEQGVRDGATLWQPSWSCPSHGTFYPPTILSDVESASNAAQEEIFGPVVVLMTFRTPEEAIQLANNTRYGLAASVWSNSIHLALEIAPKIKAGTIWINCTNLFDAASGFGGYRESGFGREGGREGLFEYVKPRWHLDKPNKSRTKSLPKAERKSIPATGLSLKSNGGSHGTPDLDRTPKLYIGGKQTRPDQGYVLPVVDPKNHLLGHVGHGNRKDLRNAVEAACAASAWAGQTAHLRAQVLYYIAENLAVREREFVARLAETTSDAKRAGIEVKLAIERLFTYAAWADKYDGLVHATPYRNVTIAMNEPLGIIGIVCGNDAPLLGFVSAMAPCIAMGNRIVIVPSERSPMVATDFYQVLDTSDVPAGVVNIVTGLHSELAPVLAAHDNVGGIWYFGTDPELTYAIEKASAGNMKRTFMLHDRALDFFDARQAEGRDWLREATQVKNIWVPYGE